MLKKKNLDPEKEAELQKEPKEKGDVPAMLLAAFLNLFLPAVIALLIFAGLIWPVIKSCRSEQLRHDFMCGGKMFLRLTRLRSVNNKMAGRIS